MKFLILLLSLMLSLSVQARVYNYTYKSLPNTTQPNCFDPLELKYDSTAETFELGQKQSGGSYQVLPEYIFSQVNQNPFTSTLPSYQGVGLVVEKNVLDFYLVPKSFKSVTTLEFQETTAVIAREVELIFSQKVMVYTENRDGQLYLQCFYTK